MGGSGEGEAVLLGRVVWSKCNGLQLTINIFLNSVSFAIQTLREPKNSCYLLLVKDLDAKKIISVTMKA